MTYLLDVDVLIALIDPTHVGHDAAHAWFTTTGSASWATCPLTENGVIRIVGHPRYPNSAGSPAAVAPVVVGLRSLPGHVFWADNFSLVDTDMVDISRVLTPAQVTDTYLLALARAHNGQLATFDRRLSLNPVRGGRAALDVIGALA
ncbi:MAG TPA: TA system VapC family ribonuclease toxin [Stellaceae bacterium]|nr:TA system VapC family ribonuclease toxin [Stellaceae bacterium]